MYTHFTEQQTAMATGLAPEVNTSLGTEEISLTRELAELPAKYNVVRWYAAYTRANHEKRVAEQLGARQTEHFLPQYESVRRWKDRRMTLQLPLFPGYVFVQIALRDRLRVLQIPGVARLVGFNGIPTALPEEDIRAIRTCVSRGCQIQPHPYVQVGRRARVNAGPLQGLEGIVIRKKNGMRFVISLDLINRSVAVEIAAKDLERV